MSKRTEEDIAKYKSEWYLKHRPELITRKRSVYHERKLKGLCVTCGAKAKEHYVRCSSCLAAAKEWARKNRESGDYSPATTRRFKK